jgi:hypothetical protein
LLTQPKNPYSIRLRKPHQLNNQQKTKDKRRKFDCGKESGKGGNLTARIFFAAFIYILDQKIA